MIGTQFKFQDVVLINRVLRDCFGKERLYVWKDTSGRGWAIIKGVLWSGPRTIPKGMVYCHWPQEFYKPMCWGELGTYEIYFDDFISGFDAKNKHSYKWKFESGGLDHVIEVLPPFDCNSCIHLITISEEESGQEDGGIVCELRWNEGDPYICSSTSEVEGHICEDYEKDPNYYQCPRCGTLLYIFKNKYPECWECKRKRRVL